MTSTAPIPTLRPADRDDRTEPRWKLAATVIRSPRLLAATPQAELNELFTAAAGAERVAAAARSMTAPPAPELATDLDAVLRRGGDIDPAEIAASLAAAQIAREGHTLAVRLLQDLPTKYSDRIVTFLNRHEDAYYEALSEDFNDVQARAAAALSSLGGIYDAQAAMDAGLVTEWAALHSAHKEMTSIREDHRSLLRAHDPIAFGGTAPALGFAYFEGLGDVVSDYTRRARGEARDGMNRVVSAPDFVLNIASLDHLREAVETPALKPWIGRPDAALDAMSEVRIPVIATVPREARRGDGRLVPGAPAFEYGMARAQNAGADRVAAERRENALFGAMSD